VLLVLEIAERAVMGIMGWSDSGIAKRYQHLTAQVRRDVAERGGGLLWQLPTAEAGQPKEPSAEPPEPGN
jgi:integrase